MTQTRIVLLIAILGCGLIAGFALDFSPLTDDLFAADGDIENGIVGLAIGIAMLVGVAAFGVTSIVASCYLGSVWATTCTRDCCC